MFAPGDPNRTALTGRTDAAGKFVFDADRDGLWGAEAGSTDFVARVMIRVGGQAQSQNWLSPFVLVGFLAVVIGGTLLSGGAGFMAGTLMGVLILGLIRTLITFQGNVNSWWTSIVVAVLVLLFILLQKAISLISGKLGTAAVPGSTS